MSSSQQLAKPQHQQFLITPQSLKEAMEYANMIASSSFCPKDMKGKPGDVLIAVQMGAELGLSPIQALQNISVINGRPCVWGDAALALVQACPHYVSHKEWEEIRDGLLYAYCEVTRKGSEPYIKCFSEKDAKKANLWGKAGPWQQYPSRMLQMRARGFALRDKFSDALKGLITREEAMDCPDEDFIPKVVPIGVKQSKVSQMITQEPEKSIVPKFNEQEFNDALESIVNSKDLEELRVVSNAAYKNRNICCDPTAREKIVAAKDKRKSEIEKQDAEREQFLAEYDGETGEVSAEVVA